LILAGIVVATVSLGAASATINEPKSVSVLVSSDAADDLQRKTGCTTPTSSQFVAVAGNWDAPVLNVTGPGCRFGEKWRPKSGQFEIVPITTP
jgi:hypothetical protein